ncbi:phage tail assembly chaperone, partial [Escherichia sp. SP-MK2]
PEWDGAKVTLREPSGDAWVKFREIVNPQLQEGEEPAQLSETQKFLRNKEADVVLFIDVLLDENGERVFNDDDQQLVSEIYGPVHARLLAQALGLGMSQEEAGKP